MVLTDFATSQTLSSPEPFLLPLPAKRREKNSEDKNASQDDVISAQTSNLGTRLSSTYIIRRFFDQSERGSSFVRRHSLKDVRR